MAVGALASLENDQDGIAQYRAMYRERLYLLGDLLTDCGMRLAIEPVAGFDTLWETPTRAFGEPVENSEAFNLMMIDKVGGVGVNFANYLRYAVCADVASMKDALRRAFEIADVHYD